MGNSNDYDYWWESLTAEDVYWSGMTENDRLYGLELKPEVDIASYELRKMADSRRWHKRISKLVPPKKRSMPGSVPVTNFLFDRAQPR